MPSCFSRSIRKSAAFVTSPGGLDVSIATYRCRVAIASPLMADQSGACAGAPAESAAQRRRNERLRMAPDCVTLCAEGTDVGRGDRCPLAVRVYDHVPLPLPRPDDGTGSAHR